MLTADNPSSDPLTQRYRIVLSKLNAAPIGNLTASDLAWMTGQLQRRWRANGGEYDLDLPLDSDAQNEKMIKRLESLALKVGV